MAATTGRFWRVFILLVLIATSLIMVATARAATTSGSFTAPYSRGQACFDSSSEGLYCVSTPRTSWTDLRQHAAGLASHGRLFVDRYQASQHDSPLNRRGTELWGPGDSLYETSLDKLIGVAPGSGTIDVSADVSGHYLSQGWSTGFHICLQVLEEYLAVNGQDCIGDGESVRNLSIDDAVVVAGTKYWLFVVMKDLTDRSSGHISVSRLSYTMTTN